ncbi:conserved hypothetical protein [Xenorhabdus nematophila str. Anatoliense]|nr:conserved hypothetical protein [Xenorhabdus nematophila str. Anatoliense]
MKNYTSIELASKLSTQPALEVILNSRSPLGGYDLYTPSNEYIISVYAPEYQSTKICLSATPIDTFAWSWLFNKVL